MLAQTAQQATARAYRIPAGLREPSQEPQGEVRLLGKPRGHRVEQQPQGHAIQPGREFRTAKLAIALRMPPEGLREAGINALHVRFQQPFQFADLPAGPAPGAGKGALLNSGAST